MVYLFLADGFEEIEALTPVDLLRRAGVEVITVGVTGKTVTGSHGITTTADCEAEEALAMLQSGKVPEMIVLPGGMPGAATLDASPVVDAFVDAAENSGAYIAAICAAPMILGKRGLLRGKRATCFPGFENELDGAKVVEYGVMGDGMIVTAKGAGVAWEFGAAICSRITGEQKALDILEAIQWRK